MMTPQLFINYKLKSVAHLPWRMMTYKALNTFIDDIFAFVIKMPTMYRIGCFRDGNLLLVNIELQCLSLIKKFVSIVDIIFFIYLYQRWIYKIDKKRVNEFGTSSEEPDDQLKNENLAAIDQAATSTVHPKSEQIIINKSQLHFKNYKYILKIKIVVRYFVISK